MIGLSHWFKRIRTSKEKESVTWNNPLFSLSSQGSLAFMTTEPMLLQVGLTMVPLVNYFSWFGQCNAGYFGLRYIHRLFLNFIVVSLDPQRVAQKPVEVLQGMTGWMPSTPLVMEGQIHCQDVRGWKSLSFLFIHYGTHSLYQKLIWLGIYDKSDRPWILPVFSHGL